MFRILFTFFIVVPIIEIAVFMKVGALLGVWPTIAIVILTAWLGAKFVKQQGVATLQSVQTKLAQGQMPSNEIISGMLLLVSGVLLLTPGFVTDIIGLLLLVPLIRERLVNSMQQHFQNQMAANVVYGQSANQSFYQSVGENNQTDKPHSHQGSTIEGEYERKE